MQDPGTLEAALQMRDRFGANAEFQAGEEMDRALELGDAGSFDKWCLVAETIAALSGQGSTIGAGEIISSSNKRHHRNAEPSIRLVTSRAEVPVTTIIASKFAECLCTYGGVAVQKISKLLGVKIKPC